jgi:hypothetical protein
VKRIFGVEVEDLGGQGVDRVGIVVLEGGLRGLHSGRERAQV